MVESQSKGYPAFTAQLMIGLSLGIAWGLFLGDSGEWVKWIGRIGVAQLLQFSRHLPQRDRVRGRACPRDEWLRLLPLRLYVRICLLIKVFTKVHACETKPCDGLKDIVAI